MYQPLRTVAACQHRSYTATVHAQANSTTATMAGSFAATYLPILTKMLLSDDENADGGKDHDDLTSTQLAALEALSRLEPHLLCQHAVPVVLKRLQQYTTDQERAFSEGWCLDLDAPALPSANRILKLFALVEGCEALDAHVSFLVSLILRHRHMGRAVAGIKHSSDLLMTELPHDWDDEEEYIPSGAEDEESDDDESDDDELDEIEEDHERERQDLKSRPKMTQEAADALSQKVNFKDAVLSLFQSRWQALAVLDPSEINNATTPAENGSTATSALLYWVARVLEASNDWLNVVPMNVAAGVVASWLNEEETGTPVGRAYDADKPTAGWVQCEDPRNHSWVDLLNRGCSVQAARWHQNEPSCLLGPQLKHAATPGAASPWQDLSGELVCEITKWLLSKPADAAALSHTSKWVHSCVAPLLSDGYVQICGFLQLEHIGEVTNRHRALVRQLVLKLLAHARPTQLVCHAEALKCFLKDPVADVQRDAIRVFGRAMQEEGALTKAR